MQTPWISFKIDLASMGASFWMLLGEARSKCDHLSKVPTPPEYARELHEITLSKGVHATTAIEGNRVSEPEVVDIIRRQAEMNDDDYQIREVQNVVTAYNGVLERLPCGDTLQLTPELIRGFNRQVLSGLELSAEVVPGEIRHACPHESDATHRS